jgi:hypothetical protein
MLVFPGFGSGRSGGMLVRGCKVSGKMNEFPYIAWCPYLEILYCIFKFPKRVDLKCSHHACTHKYIPHTPHTHTKEKEGRKEGREGGREKI